MLKNIFKTRRIDRTDIIEFHDNTFISSIIPEEELKLSINIDDMVESDVADKSTQQDKYVTVNRTNLIKLYKELLGYHKNIDILYHIYMQSIKLGNPPSKSKRLLQKYHTILISGSLSADDLAIKLETSVFNLNILAKTLLTHLQSFEERLER